MNLENFLEANSTLPLLVIAILVVVCTVALKSGGSTVHKVLTTERRSVEKFSGEASPGAVQRALEAAIRAPNHWINEPWRFRVLGEKARADVQALGGEKKVGLFDGVPGMLMVSCVPTKVEGSEKWNVKSLEDHAATACAVQNFMLSLASEGLGSKWLTGKLGIAPTKLMDLVGADEAEEHFMGIIFYGKPTQALSSVRVPRRKIGLSKPVLSKLD